MKDMNLKFKKPPEKDIRGAKPKIGTSKTTSSKHPTIRASSKSVASTIKGPGMKEAKTGHSGRHPMGGKDKAEMKKVAKVARKGGQW